MKKMTSITVSLERIVRPAIFPMAGNLRQWITRNSHSTLMGNMPRFPVRAAIRMVSSKALQWTVLHVTLMTTHMMVSLAHNAQPVIHRMAGSPPLLIIPNLHFILMASILKLTVKAAIRTVSSKARQWTVPHVTSMMMHMMVSLAHNVQPVIHRMAGSLPQWTTRSSRSIWMENMPPRLAQIAIRIMSSKARQWTAPPVILRMMRIMVHWVLSAAPVTARMAGVPPHSTTTRYRSN